MAAYAALVSLMHIIDDLQKHHSPPVSLNKQQVQSLTENVMFLQEFLQKHHCPADGDEADPLEMRIAEAAYDAEDVIESHIVEKIQPSRYYIAMIMAAYAALVSLMHIIDDIEHNPFPPISLEDQVQSLTENVMFLQELFLEGYISPVAQDEADQLELYQDLQKVIEDMDLIKREAEKIKTEKVVIHDEGHRFVPIASLRPSSSSSIGKNSDDVVHGIIEKLVSYQPDCQVIPIIGMAGIGKTFLARTVCSKPLIKEHFDICAWGTVSQQHDTREILCEILSQATNKKKEELKEELRERSEDELGLELYQKHLFGRRFLIVLDDMWSVDAWDNIQRFFPNNNNGSRVLVTTRISQLGYQLNNYYSHQMKFLDEASSWLLFSKTVFGENNCPSELEETGKEIVENCRGLPLSIVVVGGILKNMEQTKGYWESIRKNLTSVVNLENDKHCLRLLKLSYNHLPVYLKPCFLYMGVFEEDHFIKVSALVKHWGFEGFLKPIDGKSLETVAKGYLKDLVDRNLILIHELGSTGNIKWVKVHDLLRDLCLSEVKKEGFYHVVGQRSPRGISRQRRVVIRRNTSEKEVVDELQCMSHVRSVICGNGEAPRPCRNLGLLRAFHAHYGDQNFLMNSQLQQHVNLQHLAVKVDGMLLINFASLNLLWNLHTLIFSLPQFPRDLIWNIPAEIWKMPQLRHIELSYEDRWRQRGCCLPDPPSDAVVMENLQVITEMRNFKCGEEVVKKIPNIKKLKLNYNGSEGMEHDDYYCLSNIKWLSKLEALYIDCWGTFRGNASMYKLTFPQSLKTLTLGMMKFEGEGILDEIGWLPNLEKLKLERGCFGASKWKVVEGQFPSLKYLKLFFCFSLEDWTAEGSSIFPRLEKLHLIGLKELKEIPSQIGDIPTLQRIQLFNCSEEAVKCAKEIIDEQVKCQGDLLPFHVHVELAWKNEALLSLADPNFSFSKKVGLNSF